MVVRKDCLAFATEGFESLLDSFSPSGLSVAFAVVTANRSFEAGFVAVACLVPFGSRPMAVRTVTALAVAITRSGSVASCSRQFEVAKSIIGFQPAFEILRHFIEISKVSEG